jgi:DNA-directed RNA polymerase subunit K
VNLWNPVKINLIFRGIFLNVTGIWCFYYIHLRRIKLKYTRFEKARIIGARALQISMGAPSLIKIPKDVIFPIDIAMLEFNEDAIPITVKRVEQE